MTSETPTKPDVTDDGEVEQGDVAELLDLAEKIGLNELLPEWEVAVMDYSEPKTWDHYHPRAASAESAEKKAVEMSKYDDPVADNVYGPYAPAHLDGHEVVAKLLDHGDENDIFHGVSADV